MAYVLLLKQTRAEWLAALPVAEDLPPWDEVQADFDRGLAAASDPQLTLLHELGVA